jgi:asparagine N-glycosylation enzyme membrane subunit Stt3
MEKFLLHRREPFELAFLLLLIVSGITQLATQAVPGSIAALMPSWLHVAWLAMMTVGAALALWGIIIKNTVNGLFFESVGLMTAGLSLIVYGFAQIFFGGLQAALPASITFAVVIAFAFRWKELRRVIKKLPRR